MILLSSPCKKSHPNPKEVLNRNENLMACGVIVSCDCNQEWLPPWCWKHNSYPVAFADFGMSQDALAWRRERGVILSIPSHPIKAVSSERSTQWEIRAGSGIWSFRAAWFKKPFALLKSPFALDCWIDLDCEIKGALDPLFSSLSLGFDMALVPEPEQIQIEDRRQKLIFPDEITYNSGVIAFRQGIEILHQWAEIALEKNDAFMGDQNALSRVIYLHRPALFDLPPTYNWKKDEGANEDALILHYIGHWKTEILQTLTEGKKWIK